MSRTPADDPSTAKGAEAPPAAPAALLPAASTDDEATVGPNPPGPSPSPMQTIALPWFDPIARAIASAAAPVKESTPASRTNLAPPRPAGFSFYAALLRRRRGLVIVGTGIVMTLGLSLGILAITHRKPPAGPATLQEATTVAPSPRTAVTRPAAEETVIVKFYGLLPGTSLTVDDRPVTSPIAIPMGPQRHRIVLHQPDDSQRAIEVDGTKDRIIDLATGP